MSILSPKSLFYLKHQADIDAWAKLSSTVADDVHAWLSSWGEVMREHLPNEELHQDTESTHSRLLWHREAWRSGDDSAVPDVGIGLEWTRSKAHQDRTSYRVVWVNRNDGKGKALKARLDELIGATQRFQASGARSDWLSIWEYLDPVGPELAQHAAKALDEDGDSAALERAADDYRARQVEKAKEFWHEFAVMVDQALAETRS